MENGLHEEINHKIANKFNTRGMRLIAMYDTLRNGEILYKDLFIEQHEITGKTFQNDLNDLEEYIAANSTKRGESFLKYDKKKRGYVLVNPERKWLTREQILAVCKIIIESRAFCKVEFQTVIDQLLEQVTPDDKLQVKKMIGSERLQYRPLSHNKEILHTIWKLSERISKQSIIEIQYTRLDGEANKYEVHPIAITFSEFYFYLITFMSEHNDGIPIIFRIDRISHFQVVHDEHDRDKKFQFPTSSNGRFELGKFKERIQFMYSGPLRTVKFCYYGVNIEPVIDRLPTAVYDKQDDGSYLVKVEVYGNGIDMWLKSQGELVKKIL